MAGLGARDFQGEGGAGKSAIAAIERGGELRSVAFAVQRLLCGVDHFVAEFGARWRSYPG